MRVALKSIRPDKGHYFPQEAGILETIQRISNNHLIMPIAAYRFHNETSGCFLFPWAEGGNLKQFWARNSSSPLINHTGLIAWMLKQSHGLCHALSDLHSQDCRHGDLKPENILLFKTSDGSNEDDEGTLRIADVGLAKVHDKRTEQRVIDMLETDTMTGTTRYVSPEFYDKQIPRVFDVWSLGCVFIEMLMWMLYGYEKLRECYRAGINHYWQGNIADGFEMQPVVREWLDHLSRHLMVVETPSISSPDHHQATALADLFVVVRDHMLVLGSKERSSSSEIYEKLGQICDKAMRKPAYVNYSSIATRTRTRLPVPAKSAATRLSVSSFPEGPPGKLERALSFADDVEEKHGIGIKLDEANDDDTTEQITLPNNTIVSQDVSYTSSASVHSYSIKVLNTNYDVCGYSM